MSTLIVYCKIKAQQEIWQSKQESIDEMMGRFASNMVVRLRKSDGADAE